MPEQHWRPKLLITEFTALAVLIGSLYWLGQRQQAGEPLSLAFLLIPAIASLLVFISFLGLMYLRWLANTGDDLRSRVQRWVFGFLAVVLLGVWALAVAQTYQSFQASLS